MHGCGYVCRETPPRIVISKFLPDLEIGRGGGPAVHAGPRGRGPSHAATMPRRGLRNNLENAFHVTFRSGATRGGATPSQSARPRGDSATDGDVTTTREARDVPWSRSVRRQPLAKPSWEQAPTPRLSHALNSTFPASRLAKQHEPLLSQFRNCESRDRRQEKGSHRRSAKSRRPKGAFPSDHAPAVGRPLSNRIRRILMTAARKQAKPETAAPMKTPQIMPTANA